VDASDLATDGFDENVSSLIISASKWADSALTRWAAEDFAQVGLMAPMAVEHLCKAVLWKANPALLVQLKTSEEESLWILSSKPTLASKLLKTVGLQHALDRAGRVLGGSARLGKEQRDRMVNVRNGITHVGSADTSREVLLDSLLMLNALLLHLGVHVDSFYGAHAADVVQLLDDKRTETGHVVLAKLAKARGRVASLEESLGASAFEEAARVRQAQPAGPQVQEILGYQSERIEQECPACGRPARLWGDLEVESEVDFDVEPLGGGQYASSVPVAYWAVYLTPEALECPVCGLLLVGSEELDEAAVDSERRETAPEELSDDFDLDEFLRSNMYDDIY
jgi:hypothetical protein